MLTATQTHAIDCKSCGGTGQIEVSVSAPIKIKCRVCNGAGKGVYVKESCSACNGAQGIPCARCAGTGVITRFKAVSTN